MRKASAAARCSVMSSISVTVPTDRSPGSIARADSLAQNGLRSPPQLQLEHLWSVIPDVVVEGFDLDQPVAIVAEQHPGRLAGERAAVVAGDLLHAPVALLDHIRAHQHDADAGGVDDGVHLGVGAAQVLGRGSQLCGALGDLVFQSVPVGGQLGRLALDGAAGRPDPGPSSSAMPSAPPLAASDRRSMATSVGVSGTPNHLRRSASSSAGGDGLHAAHDQRQRVGVAPAYRLVKFPT